mgnify:CR=1 FL=1
MANDASAPAPPTQARTPRGINHLVLNVRDLEASHRFWTDIMGFRCVAELKPECPDGCGRRCASTAASTSTAM